MFKYGIIRNKKLKEVIELDKEMREKLDRRVVAIGEKMKELGFELEEDMKELVEMRKDIAELILTTKLKKIEYFVEKDGNGVGFYLGDFQITFFVEYGEDEEGPYYEATAEILEG
ncbi:hypothetical protein NRK67_00440 [Fusobacteria bacterium ZRK30]|nr:hypothetical protein NRK67_00440 [Fusobacteria bacterium ZRK30]